VRPLVRPPFHVDPKRLLVCQLGFQENDPPGDDSNTIGRGTEHVKALFASAARS
jgi:hypothetical protein